MGEKLQGDLVVLILMFLTVFLWFLTETLTTKSMPEEWELLQLIGDEDKKVIYQSRIDNVNQMCEKIRNGKIFDNFFSPKFVLLTNKNIFIFLSFANNKFFELNFHFLTLTPRRLLTKVTTFDLIYFLFKI